MITSAVSFSFAVGFIFFKGVGRGWNVFLWLMLIMGNGMLMCLYSLEWYARQRCPENTVNMGICTWGNEFK